MGSKVRLRVMGILNIRLNINKFIERFKIFCMDDGVQKDIIILNHNNNSANKQYYRIIKEYELICIIEF